MSVKKSSEHWDVVIKPTHNLLELRLREIWHYRDLMKLWVRREYVGAYKQTLLGPLWHFISPVFSTFIYMFIFGKIARLPTEGVPMFLFYNAGLAIWAYFLGCFNSSSGAFFSNAGIFGKVYFPRLIMPIASIISTLRKFAIQFLLLACIYVYYVSKGYSPSLGAGLLLLPVSLILLTGIGLGAGIMVSAITLKYRDLNMFVAYGTQLLMYATPIIYAYRTVPPHIKSYLHYNPLIAPVEGFKYAIFGTGEISLSGFVYSFIVMMVLLFGGIILFNKTEKNFMDHI